MASDRNLIDRLTALGEDRLEQLLQDFVNSDGFVNAVENFAQRAQETRGRLETGFRQLLQAASITDEDALDDLTDRIQLLERTIADLTPRLQAMTERLAASSAKSA